MIGMETPMYSGVGTYHVNLFNISIGDKILNIDPKVFKSMSRKYGGMLVDSGSEITLLPDEALDVIKAEVKRIAILQGMKQLRTTFGSGMWKSGLCFTGTVFKDAHGFPPMGFHFEQGGIETDPEPVLKVQSFGLFDQIKKDIFCLGIIGTKHYGEIPAILGITNITLRNFLFGCSNYLTNRGNDIDKHFSGIIGLGPSNPGRYLGGIPLVWELGSEFSYCVGCLSDRSYPYNSISFGRNAKMIGMETPMYTNDINYYIKLLHISIGGLIFYIDPEVFKGMSNKNGMLVDSGSEITYLQRGTVDKDAHGFAPLGFHFEQGGSEDDPEPVLMVQSLGLFYQVTNDIFCLAIRGTKNNLGILGMSAQQQHNFGFDINHKRIYFDNMDCGLLNILNIDPKVFKRMSRKYGGMLVDSGSEITLLPDEALDVIKAEVKRIAILQGMKQLRTTFGLGMWQSGLCFTGTVFKDAHGFPPMGFHFEQGDIFKTAPEPVLKVQSFGLFDQIKKDIFCLGIIGTKQYGEIPAILGIGTVDKAHGFPPMGFHFEQGGSEDDPEPVLTVQSLGLFYQVKNDIFCLAIRGSKNNLGILGMTAQQPYNFGFDLNHKRIYFDNMDCGLLNVPPRS
ncbi:hypothetical protein LINPERHAP2_LOCUS26847 [Linum perenne]